MTTLLPDPRTIRDVDLTAIRRLCLRGVGDTAPRFSTWLHSWIDTEQAARAAGADDRKVNHVIALPPLAEYSDHDLAQTLRAVTRLAFFPQGEAAGEFFDRLVLATAEIAAERLEARHDE